MPHPALTEIDVGHRVEVSHLVTFDQEDAFIEISGDENPLHIDDDFARESGFRSRVAHGLLVSSLMLPMFGKISSAKGFLCLEQTLKYRVPVYPGDTITVTGEVKQKSEAFDVLVVDTRITNQHGELVLSGTTKLRLL